MLFEFRTVLRLVAPLLPVLLFANCVSAYLPDSCEMLQMQALANGNPVACNTCHKPLSDDVSTAPMNMSLLDLLSNVGVQRQIELTSDQQEELNKLKQKIKSQINGGSNRSTKGIDFERELEELLIPYQVHLIKKYRFNDLVAKYGFAWTVSNDPFVDEIGTTRNQKSELLKIKEEAESEVESTKLKSLKEFAKSALKQLDAKQSRLVKSLMGTNVSVKLSALQRQMQVRPSKLDLLTQQEIKEDLNLSTLQVKKIANLNQELRESFRDVQVQNDLSSNEKKNRFIENRNEMDLALKSILLGHQWTQLEKIQFAWFTELFGFYGAIGSPPFSDRIGITKTQLLKIQNLQQKQNTQLKNDSEAIQNRARKRMLGAFNRKQQAVIRDLQGQTEAATRFRL